MGVMGRLALLVTLFVSSCWPLKAQDNQSKATCDKLPYRLGHIVILKSTDLRDHPRAATKKELKELVKKQDRAQAECNSFVSGSPGHPVSKEVSYTVDSFAAYYGRCESFCGTEKDLLDFISKEADEALKK